jgi:hypothetical protein
MRQNAQVRPPQRRAQIGVGSNPAPSPLHRHGYATETLLLVAVAVWRGRVAGLLCRLQPGVVQWIVQAPITIMQRTVAAAVLRITALVRVGVASLRPDRCGSGSVAKPQLYLDMFIGIDSAAGI